MCGEFRAGIIGEKQGKQAQLLLGTPALGLRGAARQERGVPGARWVQGHRAAEVVGRRGAANQRRADCTLINGMSFKEREVTSTPAH